MTGLVPSIFDSGGLIGTNLNRATTEQYITGSSVGVPAYVGGVSTSGSSSLSLTGITGLQEGDLVLFFVSDDGGSTALTSSGWTTVIYERTNSIRHTIAYKVMGSTVDTTVTMDGTEDALSATAWRNVEYTAISAIAESNSSTNNPDAVTATDDDSVVLVLSALDDDNSTISSPPTGYTTAVQNGRNGGSHAQMYKTGVATGAEDPGTLTWSSSDAQIAYTLLLNRTSSQTFGNFKNSGIWSLGAVYSQLSVTPLTLEYLGQVTSTSVADVSGNIDGSTLTVNDKIVLMFGCETGNTLAPAFTCNGVSATVDQGVTATSSLRGGAAIASISASDASAVGDSTVAIAQTSAGSGIGQRSFINAYRLVDGATATAQATDSDQSTSAATLTTATSVESGQCIAFSAYFSSGQGHSFSISNGTLTENTGIANSGGSGDSGFSSDASGSTTVTFSRGAGANTQGDAMVAVVYGV